MYISKEALRPFPLSPLDIDPMVVKVDRSTMRIFYVNISDIDLYNTHVKFRKSLKGNKLSEFRVVY